MIINIYLFIPLLFIKTDSSSIRDKSFKNELVPFLSSRSDPLKKDSNSLKIVSNEPFIIQLQVPNSMESEMQRNNENHKKRKHPTKKRVSKIKGLRKKKRSRRDLFSSKTKSRQEKSMEIPLTGGKAEELHLKNLTKNSINRAEILKALSSYSKIMEAKRNKLEGIKNFEKNNTEKTKHIINMPSRNLHKHHLLLSDLTPVVNMVYPSTPKFDENPHKYTYKDLMVDRERLEQKIKYIKNLLKVNDTNGDIIRVRRRSDSDRTANKIAKMFLTLSAVNGLHDKRKSKCDGEDDEDEVWDKVRRNSPSKKSSSSNEERYKVKKWIEFMKNKRTSSKTCPCMENRYSEEGDVFPLEQKLSNAYHLKETGRSSEESSESESETFYHSRDRPNSNMNQRFLKNQDQEKKFKALAKNGKKTLELPLNDLELYRSRAKQILQNAEEILDRIKEEEEKRLSSPNNFVSQLRELTSRIHPDPRNNENYLIRKIQKNLGWGPLAENKEGADQNNFMENVKSFILDPYEKAKALTDESTKKLSSYLLRNLGKIEESSEEKEEEANENDEKIADSNLQVYFERIPQKEEDKPVSASLAKEQPTADDFPENKEVLQNWQDTFFDDLDNGNASDKGDQASTQDEPFKQKMEDIIKEQQKKLNEYKEAHDSEESNQEIENTDYKNTKEINTETPEEQFERETEKENKPEGNIEELMAQLKDTEKDEEKTDIESSKRGNTNENEAGVFHTEKSSFFEKKKNPEMAETLQGKKDEAGVDSPENMRENKEFEKEVEKILKNAQEKDSKLLLNRPETKPADELEKHSDALKEENVKSEAQKSKVSELSQDKWKGKGQSREEESEKEEGQPNDEETNLEKTADDLQKNNSENNEKVLSPSDKPSNDEDFEKSTENEKIVSEKSSTEENSNARSSESQEQSETNEEDPTNADQNENELIQSTKDLLHTSDSTKKEVGTKDSSVRDQDEALEDNAKQKSSKEEINQIEGGTRKFFEHEVEQKTNHEFNELSEENKLINTESNLNSDEKLNEENLTLKSPDGSENRAYQEKADSDITKAVNDGTNAEDEEKVQEKHTENKSTTPLDEEDEARELNSSDEEKKVNTKFEKGELPEHQESFDRQSQLKAENPGNQENEFLEKKKTDEEKHEAEVSKSESHIKEMNNAAVDQVGDFNRETTTGEENSDERAETSKEGGEAPLRIETNSQNNEKDSNEKKGDKNERNVKALTLDEKGSNETLLKMSLNEDQDFSTKNSRETDVEATNPKQSDDSEANNLSKKESDKTLLVAENDQEPFNKADVEETEDDRSQKENQKNETFGTEESSETSLGAVANIKQNSENSEGDNQISTESSKDEGVEDFEEVASIGEEPQSEGSEENERHGTMSQEENKRSEETTLKESSRAQSQENQNSENSKETKSDPVLKSSSDNQDQKNSAEVNNNESSLGASNPEANLSIQEEDESKSNEGINDETLEAVLDGEGQGKLNEASQKITLKDAKLSEDSQQSEENVDDSNVKASLNETDQQNTEEINDNKMLKETNSEEPEQKQNNDNELSEGLVLERANEIAEANQIPKENKTNQNEENLLKAENPKEDKNDQKEYDDNRNDFEESLPEEASTIAMESQDREINSDDRLREENPKENEEKILGDVEGEDLVKTNLEGTDNETQETPLETAKSLEVKDERELVNKDFSEEISQENTLDDLNNHIVREKDNGGLLKSVRFGEESRNGLFDNFEMGRRENLSGENPSANDGELQLEAADVINQVNSPNSQEKQNQPSLSDLIQNSDSPSKLRKPGSLKVPKSIGKIMEDLEGKEKDDITSIQNLNPDKIDHIIYKIDEAEQHNLLQSQEIDCRKECACANEIDTKSRNIGRYEIAKDFLHWVKDLQLNRVLGDD